ncbi:MAG: SDR family NAD(P)-dependent oxidoreductase [Verrucomicrobiales bacterium]|nr:SDR family NAD(P)-dependent oxidoreductase [Verrucomicrobiales bacterium]
MIESFRHSHPFAKVTPMKLKGKTAIVTGGARGIGLGCAQALAKEGASIALADRPGSEELESAAGTIRALGVDCHPIEADAFSREGCEAILKACLDHFGSLDILVSVPAFNRRADFLDYDPEDFANILNSALLGSFHLSQLVARHLVAKAKPGKITFISSVLARIPNARCVAYSAAKAGLNSMMQTMAIELCEHQINVNAIEPGWIDTPGERQHYDDDTMAAEGRKLPWGRLGLPEEIGHAAAFLSSNEADYITGTILPVDGAYRLKHCKDIPEETTT